MEDLIRHCSVCRAEVNKEEAPILAMGGFGNPRYLCPACSADMDTAMKGRDPLLIEEAIERISGKLLGINSDDELVLETLRDIFEESAKRAKEIREGTYDFSLDEEDAESEGDDVPEELRESEEDKKLDEEDEKKNKKFDKIFNIAAISAFVIAIAVMIFFYFF